MSRHETNQKAFETIGRAVLQLAGLDGEKVRAIVQSAATPKQARKPGKPGNKKGAKLNRRPAGTVAELKQQVLAYLGAHPGPVNAATMALAFGVQTQDLAFPIIKLRKAGLISKDGERALATYQLTAKRRGRRASNGHAVQA